MSDIFVSYAKEDRPRAQTFAHALETQGWSVFRDRVIPTGKSWREVIGTQLDAANCVVVLWSRASVGSRWVLEEAEIGFRRGILVPVLIQDVTPPLGFQSLQAADLSCWGGTASATPFKNLAKDIAAVVGSPSVVEQKVEEPRVPPSAKAEKLPKAVLFLHRVLLLPWLATKMTLKTVLFLGSGLLLLWHSTNTFFKRVLFWGRVPLLLWLSTAVYTCFAAGVLWECTEMGEDVVFSYTFMGNAFVLIIGSVISSLGKVRAFWICGVAALIQIAILVGTPYLVVEHTEDARVFSLVIAGAFVGMMALYALYAKQQRKQSHLTRRSS